MKRVLSAIMAMVSITTTAVYAQQPSVPSVIRMVVPFAAGGSTDLMARALASELGQRLGNTVIVENRTGAGSLIGTDAVVRGPHDGSMMLFTTGSLPTAVATARNVQFDMNTDLLPVAMLGEGPMVVAVPASSAIKTPADLIAAAKARPDALTYGSAGVGTIGHLTAELINESANIHTRHIPYKGTSMAMVDLATGTIDWTVAIYSTLIPQISAGRVRVIGVTTLQENPVAPGVLPMASAIKGFDASTWVAVFVPAGTPQALVQRYNHEINDVAKHKAVADQMMADGVRQTSLTPEQMAAKVKATYTMWKRLAVDKKIHVD